MFEAILVCVLKIAPKKAFDSTSTQKEVQGYS